MPIAWREMYKHLSIRISWPPGFLLSRPVVIRSISLVSSLSIFQYFLILRDRIASTISWKFDTQLYVLYVPFGL